MTDDVDDLAAALREDLGETLRALGVGHLDSREYEMLFMREDIREAYSEGMREDIFEEVIFDRLSHPQQSSLFPELGDPTSTARFFEDGAYVLYWADGATTVFVSLEPEVDALPPIIDACEDAFEG